MDENEDFGLCSCYTGGLEGVTFNGECVCWADAEPDYYAEEEPISCGTRVRTLTGGFRVRCPAN